MHENDQIVRLRQLAEKLSKESNPENFQKLAAQLEELINQVLGSGKDKPGPK